jgi:putative membrane protein
MLTLDFRRALKRPHFSFIIPLFAGIIVALIFFTRVVALPQLLMDHPEQIYGLFFGLIAGSCVILIRNTHDLKVHDLGMIVAGILPGLLIFNLGTQSMPDTGPYIFASGFLAISAMMLPGISGSFILLILGKYSYIFNAIGYFKLSVLIPLAIGMLTGLITFSRLLSWVLHHYYRNTTLIITGILISSLWVIWPFQDRVYINIDVKQKLVSATPVFPTEFGPEFLISLGLMVAGIVIVLVLEKIASKRSIRSD